MVAQQNVTLPRTAAVLGTGTIGCSWAALFGAAGLPVRIFDPRPNSREAVLEFWERVRPDLDQLGLVKFDRQPTFDVVDSASKAVEGVEFVQECVPERLPLKQALFIEIEPALAPDAIVATSSSGLLLSDLQQNWRDPSRLIIAHPFNPPHLIPLVELFGNDATRPGVIDRAARFYEHCGKVTIRLKKEVPAHVANRIQAALWREAIHLVQEGVVSVRDVDLAVSAGPGLRWAIMGPHMLLNLGGGPGGLMAYCEQFKDSYGLWWDDLGRPKLTDETIRILVAGVAEEANGRKYADLTTERDAKLVATIRAIAMSGKGRREDGPTASAERETS